MLEQIDVIQTVSPEDSMWNGAPDIYFPLGELAVERIRLAMQAGPPHRPMRRILDFGCGYGRVLRHLKAAWPEAELAACDIDRDGAEFCADAFGAQPFYSDPDPERIEIEGTFNLIWAGSVFTHLDAPRWPGFLRLLTSLLEPRSFLVFTTEGRFRGPHLDWLPAETQQTFEAKGFGYAEYTNASDYGQSLCTLPWALTQLEPFPLQVVMASEHAWGGQDVIACLIS